MRSAIARALVGAALVAVVGCNSKSSPTGPSSVSPPSPTISGLTVTLTSNLVEVGGKVQAKAEARLSDGSTRDVTAQASWTSLSPERVTVDAGGMLTGVRRGQAVVQAAFEGQQATREVDVRGRRIELTVTAHSLECLGECEDFTQGDGDFSYRAQTRGTDGANKNVIVRVLSQTSSYPNNNSIIRMGTGASRTINQSFTFAMREEDGTFAEVQFNATEWDEFLGSPRVDGNMNNRNATARYDYRENGGWSVPLGRNMITLGSGTCRLRLHYSVTVNVS